MIPLLQECRENVQTYVETANLSDLFTVSVEPFDAVLVSHPTLWGYAKVTTRLDEERVLNALANGILEQCTHEVTKTFPRSHDAYLRDVAGFIELAERSGASQIYVTISPESATVSYSLPR